MRVAVIGAGIVGVTTAFELATDGHEVTVFERRSSVAEEASFANAGVIAPGYVTPWSAPGMPANVIKQLWSRHAPVRLARPMAPGQLRWLWRWWRACTPSSYGANRAAMHALAHYSHQRLRSISRDLRLEYEQASGYLILLRSGPELRMARPGLKLLAEMGVNFHLVDAVKARKIEPGLNPDTPLQAAVHLPNDEVGNCRQFAHLLRLEAQRLGADFQFSRDVQGVTPGAKPMVQHGAVGDVGSARQDSFDAVVVCAAMGAPSLMSGLGCHLPMMPVHGYSLTAPLRMVEGHPDFGPRSGVMDERFKVAISRLGQRVRVAGSAEVGGRPERHNPAVLETLHKVLDDWYPGCAQHGQAQYWKGARPMLPDGPPVLGPSGAEGVWLNVGHGSSGWALSCGSARVVADLLARRDPGVPTDRLGMDRLKAW
ncbi:MAG: D-amino acid dehydrogenase [Ideonella sp.]|nr:D-amino acid dehydrogenase [Ideonella sp.]